jgi:hypothetical protein
MVSGQWFRLNASGLQIGLPVFQHLPFQYAGKFMLAPDLSFQAHKLHEFLFGQYPDVDIFQRAVPFHGVVIVQFPELIIDLPPYDVFVRRIVTG